VYSSRLFKLAFSVLVAVVSFVVVVAVVEGMHWIRVRNGGALQGAAIRFDPLLGWAPDEGRFIHGHGEVRINTAGFRSSELVPDRPTIAMLGDSIAYGLGHANRDTPSSYLERLVGPRGFQVQNLSAPGYGTDQSYLRLRERIDELPGLEWVILVVCADNDLWNLTTNEGEGKRKPLFVWIDNDIELTGVPISPNDPRNHLDSSPLGWWAWTVFHLGPSGSEWLPRWIGDRSIGDVEARRVAVRLIEKMAHLTTSRGAAFSAVIVPHGYEMYHDPEWTEVWRAILTEADVEWTDFRRHVLDLGLGDGEVYMDGLHLTERGCELLAQFLFDHAPGVIRE
jgi:hypothetical protein